MESSFDHEALLASLSDKGVSPECPLCGSTDWRYGDHLLALRHHGDTRQLRGGGELVAAYFCRGCGFARLHAVEVEP